MNPLRDVMNCFTNRAFLVRSGVEPGINQTLFLRNEVAPLASPIPDLRLYFNFQYQVVPYESPRDSYRVTTTGYIYALQLGDKELFAYHYHPGSRVDGAHLHLYAPAAHLAERFRKAHFPTKRIAFEEFMVLAAEEFGVQAIVPYERENVWRGILAGTQKRFEDHQTWSGRRKPDA